MSDEFTAREMNLLGQLALHEAAIQTLELMITCMVVRSGGSIRLANDEIVFAKKTYLLEKEMKSDDTQIQMAFSTRLK